METTDKNLNPIPPQADTERLTLEEWIRSFEVRGGEPGELPPVPDLLDELGW
jgi:hypothetical protein